MVLLLLLGIKHFMFGSLTPNSLQLWPLCAVSISLGTRTTFLFNACGARTGEGLAHAANYLLDPLCLRRRAGDFPQEEGGPLTMEAIVQSS